MDSLADLSALRRSFDRDGFVSGGRVLDADGIAELKAEAEPLLRVLAEGSDPRGVFPGNALDLSRDDSRSHYQITHLWKLSKAFRRLIEHPRMVELGAFLARSRTLQLWSDTLQHKPAGRGAHFHWHQDAPYHAVSLDPADELVAAWIALDDADEETGCMWMAPGSHRWGVREMDLWDVAHLGELDAFSGLVPKNPHLTPGWRGTVPIRVKAGEVHFHHALTWHGSPINRSSRPRCAYSLHYMPESIRVCTTEDPRIAVPVGSAMTSAGAEFPIVYRAKD
jgi:phytanoyl-CoA hydroxylase